MAEIRVIITPEEGTSKWGGVREVDTTFIVRNKANAHEYFERALTIYEMEPGGIEE